MTLFRTSSMRQATICVLGSLVPVLLGAQSTLRGRVTRIADGTPLAGVELSVPAAGRVTTSDSSGLFSLDGLPAGRQIVQLRKVGFAVVRDTITFDTDSPVTRNFGLLAQTTLDTVKTVADRVQYRSAGLRGFEERRTNAASGYFIPEAELRKFDDKALASVITSRMSGLSSKSSALGTAILSARRTCAGNSFVLDPKVKNPCKPCYVTVFVDGVLNYNAVSDNTSEPFDFNRLPVSQYAGVEFYPSTGTAPIQYNTTGSGCGTMLLWTRER